VDAEMEGEGAVEGGVTEKECEEQDFVEATSRVVSVVAWLLVMDNGFPDLRDDLVRSSDWGITSSTSVTPELRPAFPKKTFFRNGMEDEEDPD